MNRHLLTLLAALLASLATPPVAALPIGTPYAFSKSVPLGGTFERIRYLGAVRLSDAKVDGFEAHELSGLAWDADEGLLYAVSDNGYLVHLRPEFQDGNLTGMDMVAAYPLQAKDGARLKEKDADGEGLAILNGNNGKKGDTELAVSFELRPRIARYRPDGSWLGDVELAPALVTGKYAGKNSALEGLTHHPRLGFLTLPERPLVGDDPSRFTLYGMHGERWTFPPLDPEFSMATGLETTPEGDVVLLERRYRNMFSPIYFALRLLHFPPGTDKGGELTVDEIVAFSTSDDWRIDNFEGVALHEKNRYFLVSDDNTSAVQKTIIVYVEVLPKSAGSPPAHTPSNGQGDPGDNGKEDDSKGTSPAAKDAVKDAAAGAKD